MLYVITGGLSGLVLGLSVHNIFFFDPIYSIYIYLLILAIINSLVTIISKKNMEDFQIKHCFIYVFVDIIIALILGFLGEYLGLPLYLVAIFAFGNNIYKNLYLHINNFIKKKRV
ncbi:DUF1290 domain-containing protein [Sedimentibacter sp. zth1]|uniref:DUF1290 domain-containing protein n=1 Tax=Sedimentibacter sp. zth1 TaxID=2816908 RepID=UPI001A92869F|nr:DUF1290 domain-containing protein [Sedimentibacter sp. zth1]QSX06156.1 DUF1290 domain-containing protein [Sedimentibacter sp. zth1]